MKNQKELKNIVVELSGKSSVVAFLTFLKTAKKARKKYNFIFSIAYVPSEYEEDSTNNIFALGEILKMHTLRYGHTISEMLYSAEVGVWFKMIKPSTKSKYVGTGSLNTLAYVHLCRLDVAATNGADILTGERFLRNDVMAKANQLPVVINFFDDYFAKFGVKFIRPLLEVSNNEVVDEVYESFCKEYGFDVDKYKFAKCYLFDDDEINITSKKFKTVSDKAAKYLSVLEEHMDNMLDEYRYESNKAQ